MNPNMADFGGIPRAAGGPGLGSDSPPGCHSLPRPSNPTLFHDKTIPAQKGRDRFMADRVGFDLPCGAGRLAALGCPRQPIHYRSGSNPNERSSKKKQPPFRVTVSFWQRNSTLIQ